MPRTVFTFIAALFFTTMLFAQNPEPHPRNIPSHPEYGFWNEELNVIQNAPALDRVFAALAIFNDHATTRIDIAHIGDSHIQADMLTAAIRHHFQTEFADGGRGLVVPMQVAGTNEPRDYRSSSNVAWQRKRICFPQEPLPIGIGGVTVRTTQPAARLTIRGTRPSIDAVKVFATPHEGAAFTVCDSAGNVMLRSEEMSHSANAYTAYLPYPVREFSLVTAPTISPENPFTLFGISLDDHTGVAYHAIGVNGAMYAHYNAAGTTFHEQLAELAPALIIVALGTNEAQTPSGAACEHEIATFVQNLQKYNPQASLLLVVPYPSYLHRKHPNPNLETVREAIVHYATANGIAYYDPLTAGGGIASAHAWKQTGLLGGDGVHYAAKGYALQADWLYAALMKAFRDYQLRKK